MEVGGVAVDDGSREEALNRVIGLPLLVFYGVGVTIGAGIFALMGEILRIAGDHAPLTFLIAGLIAGATGFSYSRLGAVYPVAAGEAVYVKVGLGAFWGRLVGLGVSATGIVSSAVIALSFAGYLGSLVALPQWLLSLSVIAALTLIAFAGVRMSVGFAAVITVLETGTLIVVCFAGAPLVFEADIAPKLLSLPASGAVWGLVLSASLIAFFAFVGFEDIVNMAEETRDPQRNLPLAIILTLVITIAIYLLVSIIAIAAPDREALTSSQAPLADLFASITGRSGAPIAAMATIAMVNGILVQIVMSSRVLYGMARENLMPGFLAHVHEKRRTPSTATLLVGAIIAILALAVPLVSLAKLTSIVILMVFTLVNLSLWRIGSRPEAPAGLKNWRLWGLAGAVLSAFLLVPELIAVVS
ncbi:amino acid permease [Hoeflea sp. CAU 1731]